MMGEQRQERALFSYAINLEKRVRADHPLRRVAAAVDFSFVRQEVAQCYGRNGNVSVSRALHRTLKDALDPNGILNPGKFLD